MAKLSTKALNVIDSKLSEVDEGSVRHRILTCAKNFKVSWIELGQALHSVWKDKLYREWGYMTFEAYTAKEIGIKKTTALKLLKSYYFLEKEEPSFLKKKDDGPRGEVATLPSYESVNLLRLAKNNKGVDDESYHALKRDVFEAGKDVQDVRRSLAGIIHARDELDPEEARQRRRSAVLKRFIATLRSLRSDAEASKMLPAGVLKEAASLIAKIEAAIG